MEGYRGIIYVGVKGGMGENAERRWIQTLSPKTLHPEPSTPNPNRGHYSSRAPNHFTEESDSQRNLNPKP